MNIKQYIMRAFLLSTLSSFSSFYNPFEKKDASVYVGNTMEKVELSRIYRATDYLLREIDDDNFLQLSFQRRLSYRILKPREDGGITIGGQSYTQMGARIWKSIDKDLPSRCLYRYWILERNGNFLYFCSAEGKLDNVSKPEDDGYIIFQTHSKYNPKPKGQDELDPFFYRKVFNI